MKNNKLKIWSDLKWPEVAIARLREGIGEHQLILSPGQSGSEEGLSWMDGDLAFGMPDPEAIKQLTKLKWLHIPSAGYEKYDSREMREFFQSRGAIMTNSSSVYNEPCAQHLLAMMLALARRLPQSLDVQRGDRSWPMMELRAETYLLNGQTVLISGFGAIAKRLVELLEPFKMNLMAVRRKRSGHEPIEVITESQLETYLPLADHVVNTLPANPETEKFFNSKRFDEMKAGAIFYNIGRGMTVDQAALLSALQSGRLAAAYLDVTTPEPLPASDPLWTAPNCYITPHTAGGHIGERERLLRHFLDNFNRYIRGEDPLDRVF